MGCPMQLLYMCGCRFSLQWARRHTWFHLCTQILTLTLSHSGVASVWVEWKPRDSALYSPDTNHEKCFTYPTVKVFKVQELYKTQVCHAKTQKTQENSVNQNHYTDDQSDDNLKHHTVNSHMVYYHNQDYEHAYCRYYPCYIPTNTFHFVGY